MVDFSKMKLAPIPKDSLFTVTTGEYSSYHIHGIFRAKSDIDPEMLLKAWLLKYPEQEERHNFDEREFFTWVVSKNLVDPLYCYEWYLSPTYSDPSEMQVDVMSQDMP